MLQTTEKKEVKILTIETFNVKGLTKELKKANFKKRKLKMESIRILEIIDLSQNLQNVSTTATVL